MNKGVISWLGKGGNVENGLKVSMNKGKGEVRVLMTAKVKAIKDFFMGYLMRLADAAFSVIL